MGLSCAASAERSTVAVVARTSTARCCWMPCGNAETTTPSCRDGAGPASNAFTTRVGMVESDGNQRTSGTRKWKVGSKKYSGSWENEPAKLPREITMPSARLLIRHWPLTFWNENDRD